jgi:hypothetical protein
VNKEKQMKECTECGGTGYVEPLECNTCGRDGWVYDPSDGGTMTCPDCDGDCGEHCPAEDCDGGNVYEDSENGY